jgi:hypothetical protein
MFDRRELGQFRLTIITQPHSRPTQKGYLNPKIATFRAGNFGYIISKYPKSYMISYDTPAKIGGGGESAPAGLGGDRERTNISKLAFKAKLWSHICLLFVTNVKI